MSTPILTKEESEELQKQGADAFAVNRFNARNPLYRRENTPDLTGEEIEVWKAKVKAWESGYETERLNKKG
jgi:hypothetical protein